MRAANRERLRGGQIFYVCPRFRYQPPRDGAIELVLELRIAARPRPIAPLSQLDNVMNAFYEGAYDLRYQLIL